MSPLPLDSSEAVVRHPKLPATCRPKGWILILMIVQITLELLALPSIIISLVGSCYKVLHRNYRKPTPIMVLVVEGGVILICDHNRFKFIITLAFPTMLIQNGYCLRILGFFEG